MSQKSAATTRTSHKVLDSTQLVSVLQLLEEEHLLEERKKLTRNMRKNIKK